MRTPRRGGPVENRFSGTADNVVQAGTIRALHIYGVVGKSLVLGLVAAVAGVAVLACAYALGYVVWRRWQLSHRQYEEVLRQRVDTEAHALMASGYLMTRSALNQPILGFAAELSQPQRY